MLRKKVKNLDAYLKQFTEDEAIYVVLPNVTMHQARITEIGFTWPMTLGEHLLPNARFGTASRRNAEGYEIIHKNSPLETHYRQKPWTWFEFHGRDKIEKSKIVDVPYKRYPRTAVDPYAIELQIEISKNGRHIIAAGPFSSHHNHAAILNTVHMFIELFGEAILANNQFSVDESTPRKQLNWTILPPGKRPWEEVNTAIGRAISTTSPADQTVIKSRFNTIKTYNPDFCATGQHGFNKYVIYGWEKQALYLLESTEVDNATYVLKDDWQTISAMTKAEVLNTDSHHLRLIHRKTWRFAIAKLMQDQNIPPSKTSSNGSLF